MNTILDREEYVEQAYFFRTFRERLAENIPAQELLLLLHQEILASTRLPMAVQFLATEAKHTGLLSTGFARLAHYFNPFQTFVVHQAEEEGYRFTMNAALLVLEREAAYRANQPTPPGLFVFQFETICRNRLGYDAGLRAMREDPLYDDLWRAYLETVRKQVGLVDFADLVYYRSEAAIQEQRRRNPQFVPAMPALFGEKEGKIAKASQGRDPLYLFAALQRQLNYPEVPRPAAKDEKQSLLDMMANKLRELEARLKLVEGETRGGPIDFSQIDKDLFKRLDDE